MEKEIWRYRWGEYILYTEVVDAKRRHLKGLEAAGIRALGREGTGGGRR
jgi:hypothetical protein